MPLYFAYGANMDSAAMRLRAPNSRALGRARLARHKFFIMKSGFASVKRDPHANVEGVLFDLALSDVPALDRFEEIGRGLYAKAVQPVLREGAQPVRALVYVGAETAEGKPTAAYLESILAGAKGQGLREDYIAFLASFGGVEAGQGVRWRAIRAKGI
ncbi:MAG: gamma-glutamylcyclotransferase [Methylovirgula sp.]|nr:gamma-glutamylcyclotransferase [Methylovirgula sp.]